MRRQDDFREHTSCISEAERYEKTVYRGVRKGDNANGKSKKKRSPQDLWNDVIETATETAPPSLRRNMDRLSELDNVPRKEKQFRNFINNSLRMQGKDTDAVWAHLSEVRGRSRGDDQQQVPEQELASPQPVAPAENKAAEKDTPEGEILPESTGDSNIVCPKTVKKAVKKVLKKSPNYTMKIKELRKAVKAQLMFKGKDKALKELLSQEISLNSKKLKLDGKIVTLIR